MKGKTLVIGLIIFILIVVALIYFAMTAQFKKDEENALAPAEPVVHILPGNGLY